jgi:predicted thioredoxin/glutaredoxin
MSARLSVVHRAGCDHCDDMVRELEALRARVELPPVEVLDVDADATLARRYGSHVPVLLLDGVVVCRHVLDEAELIRLLRGLRTED